MLETVDLIVFNKLTRLNRFHIFFFIKKKKDSSSKRHHGEIMIKGRFLLIECKQFVVALPAFMEIKIHQNLTSNSFHDCCHNSSDIW